MGRPSLSASRRPIGRRSSDKQKKTVPTEWDGFCVKIKIPASTAGICIFQEMKNPGGHGFFKGDSASCGTRPACAAGARQRLCLWNPQPSRRLTKRSLFRVLRDAASLRGWIAPKALPLESATFEKVDEAFPKTALRFSFALQRHEFRDVAHDQNHDDRERQNHRTIPPRPIRELETLARIALRHEILPRPAVLHTAEQHADR